MLLNTYLGRLVFDLKVSEVEIKAGESGEKKKVLNNRLAITLGKDKTTFIDVVAWEGTAVLIEKNFKKGFEILFQGHLINTVKKKKDVDFDSVAICIDDVIFTHGNPREMTLDDVVVPDFLK